LLHDETACRSANYECGVVEVASRAATGEGRERLEDVPADAHDVSPCS